MPLGGAPELEGPSLIERLSKSSTACPVNPGFVGDGLVVIADGPLSGDICLTCTVVASLLSN